MENRSYQPKPMSHDIKNAGLVGDFKCDETLESSDYHTFTTLFLPC